MAPSLFSVLKPFYVLLAIFGFYYLKDYNANKKTHEYIENVRSSVLIILYICCYIFGMIITSDDDEVETSSDNGIGTITSWCTNVCHLLMVSNYHWNLL